MAVEIPVEEINFHPTSFCDQDGRAFWWKNELYRGINESYAAFCRKLFEDGIVQRLVAKKFLVATELTDLHLNGYSLVLKHQQVPFVSYANEWCPEMLRDAGLFIADMVLELAGDGLFVDADTWDMLFDGCQPVYVDFCSIVEVASNYNYSWKVFRDDFHSYFIHPLRLMACGYGSLARWLLADYEHETIHAEFAALIRNQIYDFPTSSSFQNRLSHACCWMPQPARSAAQKGIRVIGSALSRLNLKGAQSGYDLTRQLRQELNSISLPSTGAELVNSKERNRSFTPCDQWSQKHHSIHSVLHELRPATVLDIGCGEGWYSQLAAVLGSKVIALDVDDRCIACCYQEARRKNLPILPLVMDIRYPSPGHGTGNQLIAPALRRLPCEMVLALSIVHLLVFDQHRTLEQIVETFAAFSKRWLLVEFLSPKDWEVRERWTDWYCWYSQKKFMAALGKNFRNVSLLSSDSESRVLLLCEK